MKRFNNRIFVLLALLAGLDLFLITESAKATAVDSILNLDDFQIINRTTFEISEVEDATTLTSRLYVSLSKNTYKPVGLRVEEGAVLKLDVTLLSGTAVPKLVTFTRPYGDVTTYTLNQGSNTLNMTKSGNVYLVFSSSNPSALRKARVTFQSGYFQTPFYRMGVTTNAEWQNMLSTDTISDAVLLSNRTFVVLSGKTARAYQTKNQDLALYNFDKIVKAESDIAGLDGSAPQHQPFIHSQLMMYEKDGGNPDATSAGRIRIPKGIIYWLTDPDYVFQQGGWGIMHEIGHHHQQWPYNWTANIEVHVNIHTLAAKRLFYPEEDGLSNESWAEALSYLSENPETKDYDASSTSNFVKLAMYQQLWLAFGGDSFYRKLYKKIRIDRPQPGGSEAERRVLLLYASQIAGKDLSEFFKKWGIHATQATYNELSNLGLPYPEIDPAGFSESWVVRNLMEETTTVAAGNFALKINALSPTGIKKVQFYKGTDLLAEVQKAPYEYNWQNIPRGIHQITAKIIAGDGTSQTTAPVYINATGVSLIQPLANSTRFSGESIEIVPDLVFPDRIAKIEYYQNDTKIGETSARPFRYTWKNAPDGVYNITAKVHYSGASVETSAPVTVAVGMIFAGADTYVRDGGLADTNYGKLDELVVKKDGNGYNRQAYLKFDLSKYNYSVKDALLKLNIKSANSAVTSTAWELYYVSDDSWTEDGLTWNNKPAGTVLLGTIEGKNSGTASWDITGQVNGEIEGDKVLSLLIVGTVANGTGNVSFHSRETGEISLRPVIDIGASLVKIESKIDANGDAFVRDGGYADINYGNEQTLVVKKDRPWYQRQTYLKFNLSKYSEALNEAVLDLTLVYANAHTGSTNWELYFVPDDSWTEDGITWNNKPEGTVLLGTVNGKSSGVASWDITSQVNTELASDKILSLLVVGNVTRQKGDVNFASSESDSLSARPVIRVVETLAQGLKAIEDSYVRNGSYANTNYGNEESLVVKKDIAQYERQTYLKFGLNDYSDSLANATLHLKISKANSGVAGTSWELYHVADDSWSENSLTWNNKPAGAVLVGTVAGKSSGTASWEITDLVNSEITGAGNKVVSLMVVGTVVNGKGDVNFYSSEAAGLRVRPTLSMVQKQPSAVPGQASTALNVAEKMKALPLPYESGVKEQVVIYPNPATNRIQISAKHPIKSLELIGRDGRVIQKQDKVHTKNFSWNISAHAGLYILYITTEKGSTAHKLIVAD